MRLDLGFSLTLHYLVFSFVFDTIAIKASSITLECGNGIFSVILFKELRNCECHSFPANNCFRRGSVVVACVGG